MKLVRTRERAERARELERCAADRDERCPLCGRPMVGRDALNVHHLIPRMFGGRQTAVLHRVCHAKIHSVFTEAELAREYHTFERLRAHREIAKFITWVRKQPPACLARHARPRRR